MVSFLEGPLKKSLARGFKGNLKTGLIQENQGTDQDDYGDIAPPDQPTQYRFTGFRQNYDAAWMARALIPETDVGIMILQGSVTSDYHAQQDDLIFIENTWHKVRRVLKVDPADATRELQCYVIPEPGT
jgi:hypothetical protein